MADKPERRSGLSLLMLILFGVVVSTTGIPGPSGGPDDAGAHRPTAAHKGDEAPTAGGPAKDTFAENYRRPYLGFRDYQGAAALSEADQKLNLGELLVKDLGRMAPEFLIVTVPEPIESRFGYRFDAIIDAVQFAIETQGWNLERFWLPWWPSGRQFADRSELKPVVSSDGKELLHERKPGVLLFRKPRKPPEEELDQRQRLLVVLLVGETPTSGLAKAALGECLSNIKSYYEGIKDGEAIEDPNVRQDVVAAARKVDIRIVGPVFSGAEQSLSVALWQWFDRPENRADPSRSWNVCVRTGSSDRIDKAKFLRDAGNGRFPNVTIALDSTIVHLDTVMKALFDFLLQLNGGTPLGKVALLTESDTEWGKVGKENTSKWLEKSSGTTVTTMKFPFHISQVTLAFNQSDKKNDSTTPSLVRSSMGVAIPFDETGEPRDVVPSLSPAMTTTTGSFVLAKILETVSMEDFRYIGIMATDTRDTIFLAKMIRRFCPDVQLFAPAGDLLLGHPQYANDLRGTIVATPYPLFSLAQRWDPPYEGDHRRHLFSHQGDQGTYNATVSLLNYTSSGMPQRADGFYDDLFDYGLPFDELAQLEAVWKPGSWGPGWRDAVRERSAVAGPTWALALNQPMARPALWFSIIGQRGLWPVSYLDVSDRPVNHDYTYNAQHRDRVMPEAFVGQFPALLPQFTWQWGTIFLGLSGIAWLLFLFQARLVVATSGLPRGVLPGLALWRPLDLSVPWINTSRAWRVRDRAQREAFVVTGLLVAQAVYAYVVLVPCWIALCYSPAAVFLDLPRSLVSSELWNQVPRSDQHTLRFTWLAFVFGNLTFLALTTALILRMLQWWRPGLRVRRTWLIAAVAAITLIWSFAALFVTSVFQSCWKYEPMKFERLLFFERAVNLGSGVSPLVPVLMLGLVCALWVGCQLRRNFLAEQFWGPPRKPDQPDALTRLATHPGSLWQPAWKFLVENTGYVWVGRQPQPARKSGPTAPPAGLVPGVSGFPSVESHPAGERLGLINQRVAAVEGLVQGWLPRSLLRQPLFLAPLGLGTITLLRLVQRSLPGVDFPGWATTFMMAAIWFLSLSIVVALGRFVALWLALSQSLRELIRWPMSQAYERIPAQFSRAFGRYLDQIRPTPEILNIPVQQWALVARGFPDSATPLAEHWRRGVSPPSTPCARPVDDPRFVRLARAITTGDADGTGPVPDGAQAAAAIHARYWKELEATGELTQESFARSKSWLGMRSAAHACLELLNSFWQTKSPSAGFGSHDPKPPAAGDGPARSSEKEALSRWIEAAEDLIAFEVVTHVSQSAVQLKNLAYYLSVAPILLLMSVSSYPFQPQRFLQVALWAILLTVVGCVVWVFVRMEQDELLSRVSKTRPNQVEFDRTFLTNVMAFIVPLVGVVLAQFPYVGDTLNQWLAPITGVLK